jgi:hypothetical protein
MAGFEPATSCFLKNPQNKLKMRFLGFLNFEKFKKTQEKMLVSPFMSLFGKNKKMITTIYK